MLSVLFSFLGGSAFRAVWGEISSWLNARQDHAFEIERMRLQGDLDAAAHARNIEALRVQAELGVKTIQVQAEADVDRIGAGAWADAVAATAKTTGYRIVDIWNGVIRPFGATLCFGLIVLNFYRAGWVLDARGWELAGAFLGIYVADRTLYKRGK